MWLRFVVKDFASNFVLQLWWNSNSELKVQQYHDATIRDERPNTESFKICTTLSIGRNSRKYKHEIF